MPFGPLATAGGGGGGGAPDDAQYVVMVANATLTQERVLTGTANRIVVTDGGAGAAVTLSPGALIVQTDQGNTWTVGSQIIQTAVDTTTAFQVFDSDGGDPVLTVDTVNERVGVGITPSYALHVKDRIFIESEPGSNHTLWMRNGPAGLAILFTMTATGELVFQDDSATVNIWRLEQDGETRFTNRLYISHATNGRANIRSTGVTAYSGVEFGNNLSSTRWAVFVGGGTESFYGIPDKFALYNYALDRMTVVVDTAGLVGINQTSPQRQLHISISDAVTATITYSKRASHITSGVAAPLFGVGEEHSLEDAGGTEQVASEVSTLWAVATAGNEQPLRRWTNYPNGAAGPGYGGYITADDVDNVALTIIPNGAGDVTVGLEVVYFVSESAGGTAGGNVTVLNGAAANLYADGVDTLTLAVAADGSATLQRTAGAATFDVSLWLVWV